LATEIIPKSNEDEGINFILWIIFLCLLGSGWILLAYGEKGFLKTSGFVLFGSAFVFWLSVRFYSKHKKKIKNETIKT